jgi:hypothetical protein
MQPMTIVVRNTTTPVSEIEASVGISDGSIRVNETVHDNLVPLPFEAVGAVRVWMQLVDGDVIEIAGDQVTLVATGDARFVEDLPVGFASARSPAVDSRITWRDQS